MRLGFNGVLWIAGMVAVALCQQDAKAITFAEFNALPEADKRTAFVEALRNRQKQLENVSAKSVTRAYNAEYKNGQFVRRTENHGRFVFELRRIGDSYHMTGQWWQPDFNRWPMIRTMSGYDAEKGVAGMVAISAQVKGISGRVDTEHDHAVRNNMYAYCFDGTFDDVRKFPSKYLLEHQKEITLESASPSAGTLLKVTVPEYLPSSKEPLGTRTVWLDPDKGFMIMRVSRKWERENDAGAKRWANTEFYVSKFKEVVGVWLPTHCLYSVMSHRLPKNVATIYETEATEVQLGTLKKEDLKFDFPVATEVNDRIRRTQYVVQDAPEKADARVKESRLMWWIGGGVLVVGGLAVIFLWRRR